MCDVTPGDYCAAWRDGDIVRCRVIGVKLLRRILETCPASSGWQHYVKTLIKKLESADCGKKRDSLLDEVRMVVQTYWIY